MGLRTKLIAVYLAATLIPLGLTLWFTSRLFETSLRFAATEDLENLADTLERTGREMYRKEQAELRQRAAKGAPAETLTPAAFGPEAERFFQSGEAEGVVLTEQGRVLMLLRRTPDGTLQAWKQPLPGPGMEQLAEEIHQARVTVQRGRSWDVRRGLLSTLLVLAAVLYLAGLSFLVFMAVRVTRPLRRLQKGLSALARGELTERLEPDESSREAAETIAAFNHTADQLAKSQSRLVETTRITTWQNLARKMAHEVKNSLTPIRLTMEEMTARRGQVDPEFLRQAAQIIGEEVGTLERRVKAFRDFANEPPAEIGVVPLSQMVEERVGLLQVVYPETTLVVTAGRPERLLAMADPDLLRGVLTNLLENAAQAAGRGGRVEARVEQVEGGVQVEIHDSGPGLSELARQSLFEPTISFKKGGMGLGLSIAHRGTLLSGGTIRHVAQGRLGGACFQLQFPAAEGDLAVAATVRGERKTARPWEGEAGFPPEPKNEPRALGTPGQADASVN